jgi:ankyrin repeat protein
VHVAAEANEMDGDPNPNLGEEQKSGDTCLHKACAGKHLELVKLLLGRRAHVGIKNKVFRTPLHVAAEAGDVAVVAALLKHSADPEALDKVTLPPHQPLSPRGLAGHEQGLRSSPAPCCSASFPSWVGFFQQRHGPLPALSECVCGPTRSRTAMQKLRIVTLRFGTARQKMALER